jgi:hypothetical protein
MEPVSPSVNIHEPLTQGGRFLYRTVRPTNYTHTHQANGGFWSASFTLEGQQGNIDDWLNNGLGRHIVVYGDALTVAWEGFVNEIVIPYSNLTINAGPFMDIANKISAFYSTIDTSVLPPTVGYRASLAAASNTDSQALYGIQEKVLTLGATNSTNATIVRNAYLESLAYPAISKSWATGSPAPLHVELKCLGYVHWLNNYVYNQTATTGTAPTSTKILSILAANPNIATVPFGTSRIDVPSTPANVCVYEYDSVPAWTLIQDCVAQADGATPPNRWLFGVYEDRNAYYTQAPTEIEYTQRLSDPAQRILTPNGAPISPWAVRPGKWLRFPDFLLGTAQDSLPQDKGAMFLETVTYTAPNQLQLTEGQTGDIAQLLNQLGLGGGSY